MAKPEGYRRSSVRSEVLHCSSSSINWFTVRAVKSTLESRARSDAASEACTRNPPHPPPSTPLQPALLRPSKGMVQRIQPARILQLEQRAMLSRHFAHNPTHGGQGAMVEEAMGALNHGAESAPSFCLFRTLTAPQGRAGVTAKLEVFTTYSSQNAAQANESAAAVVGSSRAPPPSPPSRDPPVSIFDTWASREETARSTAGDRPPPTGSCLHRPACQRRPRTRIKTPSARLRVNIRARRADECVHGAPSNPSERRYTEICAAAILRTKQATMPPWHFAHKADLRCRGKRPREVSRSAVGNHRRKPHVSSTHDRARQIRDQCKKRGINSGRRLPSTRTRREDPS